jgi:hypothetical protein
VQDGFLGVLTPSGEGFEQSAMLDRCKQAMASYCRAAVQVSLAADQPDSFEHLCAKTSSGNCSDYVHGVLFHPYVALPSTEDVFFLGNVAVARPSVVESVESIFEFGQELLLLGSRSVKLGVELCNRVSLVEVCLLLFLDEHALLVLLVSQLPCELCLLDLVAGIGPLFECTLSAQAG